MARDVDGGREFRVVQDLLGKTAWNEKDGENKFKLFVDKMVPKSVSDSYKSNFYDYNIIVKLQLLDLCRIFMLKSHLHWRFPYKTWLS